MGDRGDECSGEGETVETDRSGCVPDGGLQEHKVEAVQGEFEDPDPQTGAEVQGVVQAAVQTRGTPAVQTLDSGVRPEPEDDAVGGEVGATTGRYQ